MSFNVKHHWENVYQGKKPAEVSWYQTDPIISLEMIALTGIGHAGKIIDVGGGASILVDKLLDKGFQNPTILDISFKALDHAKGRLGKRAGSVNWVEADILQAELPYIYDLWHDRAVFHFLTSLEDRKKYIKMMEKAVRPGGHVIIATFALEGPLKCSGLQVERYSPEKLQHELGDQFLLVKNVEEVHITPLQTKQKFIYCYFRKEE
jgi:ubiquinone/menaquinone biosynthesis C-methylase UbiE